MSLVELQTSRLSEPLMKSWLDFLTIFSGLQNGPIELVVQGGRVPGTRMSDCAMNFGAIRFGREKIIDWRRPQRFLFAWKHRSDLLARCSGRSGDNRFSFCTGEIDSRAPVNGQAAGSHGRAPSRQ